MSLDAYYMRSYESDLLFFCMNLNRCVREGALGFCSVCSYDACACGPYVRAMFCVWLKQLLCVPLFFVLKADVLMEHDDDDANLVGLVCNRCGKWSWGREPSQIPRLAEWQLMHNPPGSDRPGWLVTNDTDYSMAFLCSLVRNLMSVRMRVLYHLMILVVVVILLVFSYMFLQHVTQRDQNKLSIIKHIKP